MEALDLSVTNSRGKYELYEILTRDVTVVRIRVEQRFSEQFYREICY